MARTQPRKVPLGQREDLHLEFKSRDALADPQKIAREVVAMLNAEGGTVWVGLRDEHDRAVAVEPIADVEWQRGRLVDVLVERIEPPPLDQEVTVEAVEAGGDGSVLRITVQPRPDRRPYALLDRGGRHFLRRIDARIRPLSREELAEGFTDRSSQPAEESLAELQSAVAEVLERREAQRNEGGLWFYLRSVVPLNLDDQAGDIEALLVDPERTGKREGGWHFATSWQAPDQTPRQGRIRAEWPGGRFVEIHRSSGAIAYRAPLGTLHWKGEENELWPAPLLEYPASLFRLAGKVLEGRAQPDDRLVADLALFGLRGWFLGAGPRGQWSFPAEPQRYDEPDFTVQQPYVFRFEEVASTPDRCAFRMVREIYEAFGLREDDIPFFEPAADRLIFPA